MAGLTPKQEGFCQAYIELSNASAAYRKVYSVKPSTSAKSVNEIASTLLKNVKVASRVKELQAVHVERHNVTVESLVKELEEARIAALTCETPQSSAAVSASMGKARIVGLDKQVGTKENPFEGTLNVAVTVDWSGLRAKVAAKKK